LTKVATVQIPVPAARNEIQWYDSGARIAVSGHSGLTHAPM